MADKVMALVERELKKNPEITNAELRAKAERVDRQVKSLSSRQFNARYPLQVKRRPDFAGGTGPKRRRTRRKAVARPGRSTPARTGRSERERVRAVFMEFASDLAAAEGRSDIVRVLAEVDRYVDAAIKAAT